MNRLKRRTDGRRHTYARGRLTDKPLRRRARACAPPLTHSDERRSCHHRDSPSRSIAATKLTQRELDSNPIGNEVKQSFCRDKGGRRELMVVGLFSVGSEETAVDGLTRQMTSRFCIPFSLPSQRKSGKQSNWGPLFCLVLYRDSLNSGP